MKKRKKAAQRRQLFKGPLSVRHPTGLVTQETKGSGFPRPGPAIKKGKRRGKGRKRRGFALLTRYATKKGNSRRSLPRKGKSREGGGGGTGGRGTRPFTGKKNKKKGGKKIIWFCRDEKKNVHLFYLEGRERGRGTHQVPQEGGGGKGGTKDRQRFQKKRRRKDKRETSSPVASGGGDDERRTSCNQRISKGRGLLGPVQRDRNCLLHTFKARMEKKKGVHPAGARS